MKMKTIITGLSLIALTGCASPVFQNFKITKHCGINGQWAPEWVCKGDKKIGNSYYIIGTAKQKQLTYMKRINKKSVKIGHINLGHLRTYEQEKEPAYGTFLFYDYYKRKALMNAENKFYNNYKTSGYYDETIVQHWINPKTENMYILVKFQKKEEYK